PDDRLEIELWANDARVATTLADRAREDLQASGIGDGGHAFDTDLPDGLAGAADDGAAAAVLVARARSPSTGAVVELKARPREPEREPARELGASALERVVALLERSVALQRQVHFAQQAGLQGLRAPLELLRERVEARPLEPLVEAMAELQQSL